MASLLITEDDDDIRTDLAELLDTRGYQTSTARNGLEALDLLHSGARPDLILLDLMMPVMDGWQLRRVLLEEPELAKIPVLLVSSSRDLAKECAELGVAGHITKPFGVEALVAEIERCLAARA